ncbi:hypothetical protein MMC25_004513 [Agyrium rufum]|nr:hypothetical protein [Agyrium rufum]
MDPIQREITSHDEEKRGFLPESHIGSEVEEETEIDNSYHHEERSPRGNRTMWYMRLVVEVVMGVMIIAMLLRPYAEERKTTSKTSPVPKFPRDTVVRFLPNATYMNDEMFDSEEKTALTLHNWIPLSAAGRGYVEIENYKSYNLAKPYDVPVGRSTPSGVGPGFMVSMFHQLHCLSYIVQHLQAGYGGVELTPEVAHHSAHCFDYIRQAIMCAGDTALEGHTDAGPGFGNNHRCVDYQALLAWANERSKNTAWNRPLPDMAVL